MDRNLQSQRINNSKILPQSNKKPTFYFFFFYYSSPQNGISPSMLISTYTTKILPEVQKTFPSKKKLKTPHFLTLLIPDLSLILLSLTRVRQIPFHSHSITLEPARRGQQGTKPQSSSHVTTNKGRFFIQHLLDTFDINMWQKGLQLSCLCQYRFCSAHIGKVFFLLVNPTVQEAV